MAMQTGFQSQLKDPKQKRLLVVAFVLLATAGVVIWRTLFGGGELPADTNAGSAPIGVVSSAVPAKGARESDLKRIELDTKIIESDIFKNLRTYSPDIPVRVTDLGNTDPFHQRFQMPVQPVGISPAPFIQTDLEF